MRRIPRKRNGVVQMRDLRQATPGLSGLQTRERCLQGCQKSISISRRERFEYDKYDRKELRQARKRLKAVRIMKCENCPYAMPCYSGKLLTPVITVNGIAKLCLYCECLVITLPNGTQERFRCELRPVTPELVDRSRHQGKMVPDPGPTDKAIETIQCSWCRGFLMLKGAYGGSLVCEDGDRFNTQKKLILEVAHTDGTDPFYTVNQKEKRNGEEENRNKEDP